LFYLYILNREDVTSPPPHPEKSGASESQSQGASLKRKWGEQGCNKISSGLTYVTAVDLNGLPTEPLEARKALKCACGFQVRENVSITIHDWRLVLEITKEQLWRNITEIKYPDGVDEEFVKTATMISMG
jgi:hypothetical protein